MLRTSRCFAALFFQFGGPNALSAAEPFLHPRLVDCPLASVGVCSPEKLFFTTRAAKFADFVFRVMNKMGTNSLATAERSTDHNARGKVAAHCTAVG